MRQHAQSTEGFSLDGCKTRGDVDARREFLKHASNHQRRAHHFSDGELHALRTLDGADVPPFRLCGPLGSAEVGGRVFIPA